MKNVIAVISISALIVLSACSGAGTTPASSEGITNYVVESTDTSSSTDTVQSGSFSTDVSVEIKKSDIYFDHKTKESVTIALTGDSAECASDLVDVSAGKIVIKSAGVYVLKGEFNGTVSVEAADTDKVYLVLEGASINAVNGPAIYAPVSEKTIILLPDNTVNSLSDSEKYDSSYDDKVTGVVYSKENLTITGPGTLEVNALHKDGIVTKDKLKIIGSTVNVTATDDGIVGKDLLYLSEAVVNVTSGDDGLKTSNDKSADKGTVLIENSTVNADAGNDAVNATNSICFAGSTVTVNAVDDAVHSDRAVTIESSDITVISSHEGFEATKVLIKSGNIRITSDDDAINAIKFVASKAESAFGETGGPDTASVVSITGGNIVIDTKGDAIDSNDRIEILGGTVYVYGVGSGNNYSFDCAGEFVLEKGTVIALDVDKMFQPTNDIKTYPILVFDLSSLTAADAACEITGGSLSVSFTAIREFGSVSVISDAIKSGESYSLSAGGTTISAAAE